MIRQQRGTRRRILAMVLAALLVFSVSAEISNAFSIMGGTWKSLSSLSGVRSFDYASTPVRESFITKDMVDPGYSFKCASKAVDEYFGTTSTYTADTGTKYKGFKLSKNEKGECGVWYRKLFRYQNQWVDVKTTYMNWSAYNDKKAFFSGGFCSSQWTYVKWMKLKHEFYIAGTNTKINVKGFFTYVDIDRYQGIAMPASQVDKVWVNDGSTYLKYKKEDSKLLIRDDSGKSIVNYGQPGYSKKEAAKATFSYEFSGKTHTQYILHGSGSYASSYSINFEAAKYIPSSFPKETVDIDKWVSDADETEVLKNTVPSRNSTWRYYVNGMVPLETESGNFYDAFQLKDAIESCLSIEAVDVIRDTTTNVTDEFTITQSGQTVTAKAKNVKTEGFYSHNYQLRIKVKLKSDVTDAALASHGHFNSAKTALTFKNTGSVIYTDGNGSSTRKTPTTTTILQLPTKSAGSPGLKISKSVSKPEWQVGDLVSYTIKVSQTNQKATATHVVVTDTSLPDSLAVQADTLRVSGGSGAKIAKRGNGFQATASSLAYGATLTITFQARATQAAANTTVPNTAKATADFVPEQTASAQVRIKQFDIEGTKTWVDEDDNDGLRPESVIIRLLADGQEVASTKTTAAEGWSYRFANQNRYNEDGSLIQYTVKEDPVKGYTASYDGYDITNTHTPEKISVSGTKIWKDAENHEQLRPGKVVISLLADGKVARTKTVTAEDRWAYSFPDLYKYRDGKQVEYTVREAAVDGYTATYRKTVDTDQQMVWEITNTHLPNAIELTKTELLEDGTKTDTPVAGAVYRLYQMGEDAEDTVLVGQYTTDANGRIYVEGLDLGSYYFEEDKAPYGYQSSPERIPVEIKASGSADAVQVVKAATTDQRSCASIHVSKVDNGGNRVEGAVFGLYSDKACAKKLGEYTTKENGTFAIEALEWGTYYLKELKAPKGYQLDPGAHAVVLGKDTTIEAQLELVNEQKRGSVVLTKTDETETLKLPGAVFDLYQTDGTLVKKDLKTGSDGTLLVEGLAWGSYYFKETKAPAGYGLSQDLIRFSVNATTGGIRQEVVAINYPKTCEVHVTKRIQAEELHWDHGVPTFLFQLTGTTVDGEDKTYTQTVTFSKNYVSQHTDANGYVEADASFLKLKAGDYSCQEIPVQRYALKEIREVSENGTIRGGTVAFDLMDSNLGAATFVNEKTDWEDYSDTTSVTNLVKMTKKLTAIIAEYTGPEVLEGNSLFDKADLIVTAVYDDGTERVLEQNEYTLRNGDGTVLEHVNKAAGTYTAKVSYTEKGITRTGTFDYTVKAAKQLTVRFDTTGGESLADLTVYQYDRLQDYAASKYTPVNAAHTFAGWYSDAALTSSFSISTPITADQTLYAGWNQKHLNVCSWKEIKEVADAGNAERVFSECFEAVKADLAKDGVLSVSNYQHTKAFSYKGKTYHAMIAGFGQDTKATGSKAGISFLVYEKAGTARMNDEDTNVGGWSDCTMRTETLASLLNGLPADLKSVIASVEKTAATKAASGTVSLGTTQDKLWLPSQAELYGAWGYENAALTKSAAFSDLDYGALQSLKGEGSQYALFQGSVPDGTQMKEAALTRGARYWTRSLIPTLDGCDGFCSVDDVGGAQ